MHNFCFRLCNCLCLCLCDVFVIVFVFVRETIGKELSLALSEAFAAPLLRTSPLKHPSDSRLISQGEKVNTNSKSFLPRHTHVQRYKHTQFGTQGKKSIWDANNISFSVDTYVKIVDVSGRGAASAAKLGLEVYPPIQNLGDLNLVVFLRPIIYLAFTTWPFVYCLKKLSLTIVVPFSKASLSCFFASMNANACPNQLHVNLLV